MNSHPAFLWLQQPPRSQLSTFQWPYHFTLLGAPFEPVSGFRLTACNSIWIFIKTTFTHPRTPRYGGQCLSTHSGFRPLHSEVRQCSTHILTMSMRHPAYRQRRPPLDRFRIIDYDLRLLSADFTELLTQIYLLHQRQSEYQCGRFKALPYHSTHRVISSASIFFTVLSILRLTFSVRNVSHRSPSCSYALWRITMPSSSHVASRKL